MGNNILIKEEESDLLEEKKTVPVTTKKQSNPLLIIFKAAAFFALITSGYSILKPNIYFKVVSANLIPIDFVQDLTTFIISGIMLFIVFTKKIKPLYMQLIFLCFFSYTFYIYGIFTIERYYNYLYFNYLTVFGLSFYGMVLTFAAINKESKIYVTLPNNVKNISIAALLLIPVIFLPMWGAKILELINNNTKPEFYYSVYLFDLSIYMPMYIIVAILLYKRVQLGILLAPFLFILVFPMLFPVAIGEFIKPWYNLTGDISAGAINLGITLIYASLSFYYFKKLEIN